MKLASLKTEGRDGRLVVTSRDLSRCVAVADIAPSLQTALDNWADAAPRLEAPPAMRPSPGSATPRLGGRAAATNFQLLQPQP